MNVRQLDPRPFSSRRQARTPGFAVFAPSDEACDAATMINDCVDPASRGFRCQVQTVKVAGIPFRQRKGSRVRNMTSATATSLTIALTHGGLSGVRLQFRTRTAEKR